MMIDLPSPEEIESRITHLDAIDPSDIFDPSTWFDIAMERMFLQLAVVWYLLQGECWEEAIRGLVSLPDMAKFLAIHATVQLPHDRLLVLVREKLEVLTQHPMRLVGEEGHFAGFAFDHPEVPDRLPEDLR